MNTGKELLFFFSALGAFNGIILGAYFFFFTKKKYFSNYFLGALLFALSIRIAKSVFIYFDPTLPKTYLQIGLSACFFIGPFLYYFFRASVKNINAMPRHWKLILIFWLSLIVTVGILYPYKDYPTLWNLYFVKLIYLQWFIYIIFSGFTIKTILETIVSRKQKASPAEIWLGMIYLGNVLLFTFYFLALINAPSVSYISGSIIFSFILYLIISILLYRKKTDDLFLLNSSKHSNKKVNSAEETIISEKLENIMIEKELYKNPNLTLQDLAKEINNTSHQLSQFLNANLGKNFTTYVNEFRINEACKIMTINDKITLESIGYDVGFNSKSTFFAAFKKHTGTTPANYQQRALLT